MIVISLALVIAAAVSLFIGLFVVTDTLTFIFGAIVLCLVSLLLLWLGTRSRKVAAQAPSAPVYGGGARAGGSTAPARAAGDVDELDELTSPDGATVVRKTTARDRAATRVASASAPPATASDADSDPVDATTELPAEAAADTDAPTPVKKATARKAATKKAATKKATAKKAVTRKATAKKATAKKAATKKATAKKAPAKKAAAKKTTGAQARARLAEISGVGPAKQDALLKHYGSLEAIRDASVDDIVANVKGFGESLAGRVKGELS